MNFDLPIKGHLACNFSFLSSKACMYIGLTVLSMSKRWTLYTGLTVISIFFSVQGEDRWLCTLLLQQGYRVEYSAAADALTYAPEGFDEFYNQRRRWSPSTMANILDLLGDWKNVMRLNENISGLYIAYQLLLFLSSMVTPATIFLLVVGALNSAFQIDLITSLCINLVPLLLFLISCFTVQSKWQVRMMIHLIYRFRI